MFTWISLFQRKISDKCNIFLSKQQTLDADPKVLQQVNFNENLSRPGDTITFFITE